MAQSPAQLSSSDIRYSHPQRPVTSALVPGSECEFLFGDNSTHGLPNPWNSEFKVLHVISAVDREQYHYIFRALSRQDFGEGFMSRLVDDDGWFGVNNLVDDPSDHNGIVFSAFRVLVDGGDESDSILDRADRVPKDQWQEGRPPPGRSGISRGDRWVRFQDLPQAKLEETLTAYVYIQASKDENSSQQTSSICCSLMDWRVLIGAENVGIEKMLIRHSLDWAKENGFARFEYQPRVEESDTVPGTNGVPVDAGDFLSDIMVADYGFKIYQDDNLVVSKYLADWDPRAVPRMVVG